MTEWLVVLHSALVTSFLLQLGHLCGEPILKRTTKDLLPRKCW